VPEATRLKKLELDNGRRKHVVTDVTLEYSVLKDSPDQEW